MNLVFCCFSRFFMTRAQFHTFSQEFNIEKLQFIEAEKAKVRKEYERKEQQIDIKKKM